MENSIIIDEARTHKTIHMVLDGKEIRISMLNTLEAKGVTDGRKIICNGIHTVNQFENIFKTL